MSAVPILLFDREFDPEVLGHGSALDIRNIGPDRWGQLVSSCRASDLRLYHLTVPSLEGIQGLRRTKALTLQWANKITTVDPVFEMDWLETLSIIDLPKLRSIAGVGRLQNLTKLTLSGNQGSLNPPLRLETLRPLVGLSRLERLSIQVLRLEDDDIKCIASISTLRSLELSNQFARDQFAYLAKNLNAQLEEPISAYREVGLACKECGAVSYMFTGRRQPILCRTCDSARFDKQVDAFEALVAAA